MEPIQRTSISSAVVDEITEYMRQTFVGARSRFARPQDGARFDVRTSEMPFIAADRIRSTLDYSQVTDPFDFFLFFVVNGGAVRMEGPGGDRVDLIRGDATVTPIGVPVGFEMHDIDLRVLRLPVQRLEGVAEEAFGMPGSRLRFDGRTPVSPAMNRYWQAVVNLANAALMDLDSPMLHPLFAEEVTRSVAVAALHTFPNTTMSQDISRTSGEVAPAAVRTNYQSRRDGGCDNTTAVLVYDTRTPPVASAPGAECLTVRDGKIVYNRFIFDRLPFEAARRAAG